MKNKERKKEKNQCDVHCYVLKEPHATMGFRKDWEMRWRVVDIGRPACQRFITPQRRERRWLALEVAPSWSSIMALIAMNCTLLIPLLELLMSF